jgi:2-keto-4-pentenoate hydratase/2-oxohepta-3-ene-1,7-dioic acid hydratase in catechol pathway
MLRHLLPLLAGLMVCAFTFVQESSTQYVRYLHGGQTYYGILNGDTIRELDADPFSSPQPTGKTVALDDVKLLPPTEPSKVIAVGLNFKSHIGDRPTPEYPGLFAKFPSSLVGHQGDIVVPPDSKNLHYEGELVVVIGKKAQNVSVSDAPNYVFGVTAGNDISERDWQRADLQWVRAKASDTFGPVGPAIVTGLDYNDLLVQTRVNGEVRQKESSKDLVFGVDQIVSYVSKYVTLLPGDLIFTGTPQSTKAMRPGDVVEVEIEGVGILRNTVVSADGK